MASGNSNQGRHAAGMLREQVSDLRKRVSKQEYDNSQSKGHPLLIAHERKPAVQGEGGVKQPVWICLGCLGTQPPQVPSLPFRVTFGAHGMGFRASCSTQAVSMPTPQLLRSNSSRVSFTYVVSQQRRTCLRLSQVSKKCWSLAAS